MALADYTHHNEEAERVWWEEEGRWHDEDDIDAQHAADYGPAEAYAEELTELDDVDLIDLYSDRAYTDRWPQTVPVIRAEMARRGITLASESPGT